MEPYTPSVEGKLARLLPTHHWPGSVPEFPRICRQTFAEKLHFFEECLSVENFWRRSRCEGQDVEPNASSQIRTSGQVVAEVRVKPSKSRRSKSRGKHAEGRHPLQSKKRPLTVRMGIQSRLNQKPATFKLANEVESTSVLGVF